KLFIKLALLLVVLQSCGKKTGSGEGELGTGTETGNTGGTDGTLTISYVSGPTTLRVASAGTDTCGDFVFNLKKKTANEAGATMAFTLSASGEDAGALLASSAVTDASGNATVRYCS